MLILSFSIFNKNTPLSHVGPVSIKSPHSHRHLEVQFTANPDPYLTGPVNQRTGANICPPAGAAPLPRVRLRPLPPRTPLVGRRRETTPESDPCTHPDRQTRTALPASGDPFLGSRRPIINAPANPSNPLLLPLSLAAPPPASVPKSAQGLPSRRSIWLGAWATGWRIWAQGPSP